MDLGALAVGNCLCNGFDVDGDGFIDGVELAWLGLAFGSCSGDPSSQWWFAVDYTEDGCVDGEDLSLLGVVWHCQGSQNECE